MLRKSYQKTRKRIHENEIVVVDRRKIQKKKKHRESIGNKKMFVIVVGIKVTWEMCPTNIEAHIPPNNLSIYCFYLPYYQLKQFDEYTKIRRKK